MIANVVPSFGTYMYLEEGDLNLVNEGKNLEGKMIGFDGQFYSPIVFGIKDFKYNKNKDKVNYFCNSNLESFLFIDKTLFEKSKKEMFIEGKTNLRYENIFGEYNLIIADVEKLKEMDDKNSLTLYSTIYESIFNLQHYNK